MVTDQINRLIAKLQVCESYLESYSNRKKITVSFKEMWRDIEHVMSFFNEKDLKKGDKVGIIGSNSFEWVVIDLACIAAGIITMPFDPAVHYDIEEILKKSEIKLLLTNLSRYKGQEGVSFFDEACQYSGKEFPKKIDPVQYGSHDELSYKFTSGSTQTPKIIVAQKQSVDAAITFVQQLFHHNSNDKIMVFLPLHIYQQRYWLYSAILFDFNLLLVPKELVFYSMQVDQPTVIMGVPFFFETIRKSFLDEMAIQEESDAEKLQQQFHQYLGGKIRYLWTGSAPIDSGTLGFYENMKVPLYQGYGMNEVCIVSKNYPNNNKTGSVGKLLPGKYVRFDENNQLLVKSDYPVNDRYYLASDRDNEVTFLKDGYVATGDTGYMDDDGYLYINGRIKELIILANAVKIFPSHLEKRVESSPLIKHCIVYGNEHPYLIALVVPQSYEIDENEIKKEISRINETFNLYEKICNFIIVRRTIAEENKYLSAQNKLMRGKIVSEFQEDLEKLYVNK